MFTGTHISISTRGGGEGSENGKAAGHPSVTEMSNSDGCVSSHSMSPQCHMHSSLSSAAPWRTDGCMAPIFTMEDKSTETEAGCLSLFPACKEEVTPEEKEKNSSLVQVKPEPLQIKEEQQEELLQRPEEADGSTLTSNRHVQRMEIGEFPHLPACREEVTPEQDERNSNLVQDEELLQTPEDAAGSTLTLLAVKCEDDEDENRHRATEPLAEHMETQAYINYWVPSSQSASDDQVLSSNGSESDITEDSDDWEETREDQSAVNKLNTKLFQDRKSSKQTPSMRTQTGKKSLRCTECGKGCSSIYQLRRHLVSHAGENPISCTDCGQFFDHLNELKKHMKKHRDVKPFNCYQCTQVFDDRSLLKEHTSSHIDERCLTCTECGKVFVRLSWLKTHMRAHTGSKTLTRAVNSKGFGLKPEPLQIKEEQQEELLQRPEEDAGSTLTSLAVKCEDDENGDTEPVASTSTEHMKTQGCINFYVPSSQPANDNLLLSSNCSESDITEDSDGWEETREDQSDLNKLNTKLFQDRKSSKQTPSMRTQTGKKSLRCTECGKGFSSIYQLRRHLVSHAGENPISCTDCGQFFDHLNELKKHMRKHRGVKPFNCYQCTQVFDDRSLLKEHTSSHIDERCLTCTECGKVFVRLSWLKTHMKAHTGSKTLTRAVNSKGFGLKPEPLQIKEEQKEELLQRPEEDAGATLTSLAVKREDDENGDTEPLASTSTEHMKTQAYINYSVLSSQPASDDQVLSPNCSESDISEDGDLKRHIRVHPRKKGFACAECSQVFGYRSHLDEHMMRTHTREKLFNCTECGKGWSSIHHLNAHMRIHTGESVFTCTECGKVFIQVSHLRHHLVSHAGGNGFSCTDCGKHFVKLINLRRHMRFHTCVKPFTCYKCSQVFDDRSLLKKHVSSHIDDKCITCPECGRVFRGMAFLKRHMSIHTGSKTLTSTVNSYTCSECGKVFNYLRNMKQHMVTHAGENPIRCTDCGKPFVSISDLRRHMMFHKCVKPFICYECGDVFDDRSLLKEHMSSH